MRSRLTLAVTWLAVSALAAPGAPVAEEVSAPADPSAEQTTPPAPPAETSPTSGTAPPPPAPPPPRPAASAAPQAAPETSSPGEAAAEPSPTPAAASEESAPDRPAAFASTPGSVTIEDFSFGPSAVTVNVGESVTWRNSGPSTHSATSTDGSFDTGLLARGESGSATFEEAGTFSYLCTPHPSMKGTVRVVAQASGDDTSGDDGSAGDGGGGDDGSGSSASPGDESNGTQLAETGTEPLWLAVTGVGLLLIGGSGALRGRRARS